MIRKSHLKSLIKHIVKEAVEQKPANGDPLLKRGLERPMGAVNVGENRFASMNPDNRSAQEPEGQRKLLGKTKPSYGDQLRIAYNKAKKEKNAEAMAYYQLLGNTSANVPFEKFKGSWAYGEWIKKPEVITKIKEIQDELKRFSWKETKNLKEKISFDGRYQDDMESGLTSKTHSGIRENTDDNEKLKQLKRKQLELYKQFKNSRGEGDSRNTYLAQIEINSQIKKLKEKIALEKDNSSSLKIFNNKGKKFKACNQNCARGFITDRKMGLIYGPYKDTKTGAFFKDAEEASMNWDQCVYCGNTPNSSSGIREDNNTINNKSDLFVEESIISGNDFSYNVIWRGQAGEWSKAFDVIKNNPSTNRLELWSKSHAESPKGFAPMAFREKNSKVVMICNTLKMLMRSKSDIEEPIEEMSSSGAAGAYQTPFAFSKNKMGSNRAIQSAKKYGTVVKSISEKIK